MITKAWLNQMYKLQYLIRYNPQRRINNESVAAHSFFTSVIAIKLCDILGIEGETRLKIIEAAILHDTPESFTNDITHDVKQAIPELDGLLERFEKDFIQTHFPNSYDALFGEEELVRHVLKLADTISVLQYCNNEVQMGNEEFLSLRALALLRCETLAKEIERSGFECPEMKTSIL